MSTSSSSSPRPHHSPPETVGINIERDLHGNPVGIIITNYYYNSETETIPLPIEPIWTRNILDPIKAYCGNSRKTLLDNIHLTLQSHESNPVVVGAIGGMGKTELARMYLNKYGSHYKYRIWITASSPYQTKSSFTNLAEHNLKLPNKHKDGEIKNFDTLLEEIYILLFKTRVQSFDPHRGSLMPKNCLLIFDDAEDSSSIEPFLPKSFAPDEVKPAILITSNIENWSPNHYSLIPLQEFDIDDISEFIEKHVEEIKRRLPAESAEPKAKDAAQDTLETLKDEAQKLKKICGGLPLALDQIVTYINDKDEKYQNRVFKNPKYYGVSQFIDDFNNGTIQLTELPPPLTGNEKGIKTDSDSDDDDDDDPVPDVPVQEIKTRDEKKISLVWELILKKITNHSKSSKSKPTAKISALAIQIVKSMQLMNCDSIPSILIHSLFPKYEGDDLTLALNLLLKYSVIREHTLDRKSKYYSIHPIIQNLSLEAIEGNSILVSVSDKDIVGGLLPFILELISNEEYSQQVFKFGPFWLLNIIQVYHHLIGTGIQNYFRSSKGNLTEKDMFRLHADHCSLSKSKLKSKVKGKVNSSDGCIAYKLFTILLGGLVIKELYQVIHQSIIKTSNSNPHSEAISSQWRALKSKPKSNSTSNSKRASRKGKTNLLYDVYLFLEEIPNPPMQLAMQCLKVIGLVNEDSVNRAEGLKVFFRAFRRFLKDCKKVEFSAEIISQFETIVGVGGSDFDEVGSSVSRPTPSSAGSTVNCNIFRWSTGLRGDSYKKLGDWVEKVADFLRESRDENTNEHIFNDEFVDATETFLLTICGKERDEEEIYIWFVWLFRVFELVESNFPENERMEALLGEITSLYEAMTHGKVLDDHELFPLTFANQHEAVKLPVI